MFADVVAPQPLLQDLNPEQRAAVTLPEGNALILAGAGSGKTRVLTTRIAWLLSTGQVSPAGVLAVTFTNKAAREMVARLSAMLPVNVRGMWIGTFHGLCNRLLRAHHQAAGLPATFQILDAQDQLSAVKRVLKAAGADEERFPPKQLQWFIAGQKEDGLRPAQVQAVTPDDRRRVELYQLYEDQCQREGVVDFGELLLRSYELLRDHAAVRAHYQRRFRHILIDEFQDTNRLQYAWIRQLAGLGEGDGGQAGGRVFAVGDDDQSIYAFRGARVGNMQDFVREFAVAAPVKLERNYRSHGHILDSANALIRHNSRRLGKDLRTDAGAGEPVRVAELPSDHAEAQWVVEEIGQLLRDGSPRHQIALLYRSNAQSRALETALFNAGLPYRVYGGLRFFERAEIKHALAYLRLIENPDDDTSFLRVANFPPRGIGARTLEQLQDAARAAGVSLHAAVPRLGGRAAASLGAFVAMLDVLRERTLGLTLKALIGEVLERSGLLAHYRAEKDGADRLENLDELLNAAESFVTLEGFGRDAPGLTQSPASQGLLADEASTRGGVAADDPADAGETLSPLAAFLAHAALESGDNQAQAGQDAVQLMTVHAAKGLEFDAVFITGLEEGLFPHENSLASTEGLEEERRLMYVAITRARRRLYLTHTQTRLLHGQTRYNLRSRFLDELPESALKWLTPRLPAAGGRGSEAMGTTGRDDGLGWNASYSIASRPYSSRSGSRSGESLWADGRHAGATVATAARSSPQGLRIGQRVFHTKFGEGTVLTLEGGGDDARAQVNFPRHGVKWLALSVARLVPVD